MSKAVAMRSLITLFCLAILLSISLPVRAQTTAARPDRGTMPNGSYSVSDFENISLSNGNVNLTIPLAALPPIAGGKLSWTLNAHYNSKLWDVTRAQDIGQAFNLSLHYYVVDSVQPSDRGGWRISGQYGLEIRNASTDFDYELPAVNDGDYPLMVNHQWYKVVFITPDGSEHELRPMDFSPFSGGKEFLFGYYSETPATQGTMRYYSVDGSFLYATVTSENQWTVYSADGLRIVQTPDGVQRLQDTNGNKIKIFTDSQGTHYQDELTGREIRYSFDQTANGGNGQGRVWYQPVNAGSNWMHIDINFDTTTVQGKLYRVNGWKPGQVSEQPCFYHVEINQPLQTISDIVFPETELGQPGRQFSFDYNSDTTESATHNVRLGSCFATSQSYTRQASKGWGSISRIVTPAGAEILYSYSMDSGTVTPHSLLAPDDIAAESITRKTIVQAGPDDVWTYAVNENGGTQTYLADNSVVSEFKYIQGAAMGTGFGGSTFGLSGLVYRTTKPFTKIERHWTNLVFSGANLNSPGGTLAFNPVVDAEYTTLTDAAGNALKMSAKTFQHDFNGNVLQTTEYDWFDPASVSRDSKGVPTGVPGGATVLRVSSNTYYNPATSASSGNVYAKRSLATGTPLILDAEEQTTVGPRIERFSYDGQSWGTAPTKGNITSTNVWSDVDNKWITTSSTYDTYGNVITATDGRGKVTQFFYEDSTHALPTRIVVDPQNGTGAQTTSTVYDPFTGLVLTQTDVNGNQTTIDYTNQLLGTVDPFGRPGVTRGPVISIGGSNHRRSVTASYFDSTRQMVVATDLNAENDKLLKVRTTTDHLGRPILTEQTEDGVNYTVFSQNAYLDMGRVTLTSSAMRNSAANTDSWTRTTRDAAGRVTEIVTLGGATQPAWTGTAGIHAGTVTTVYDGNFVTVTDQAGKVRRSMNDAAGRLRRVDEPNAGGSLGSTSAPEQSTSYTYDVFDNLTQVNQGSQTRSFTYDSLSRLRTALNPESGTMSYQYDDNGNLIVKSDGRGVSAHFAYDSINRITRRWYNGSSSAAHTIHNDPLFPIPVDVGTTNEVKFYYDTQTVSGAPSYTRGASIGRLVAQTYGTGSNGDYFAYDTLGRPTLKYQQVGTINYLVEATYNLAGALTSLKYPSGNIVTNTYDQSGRLITFAGNLGSGGSSRTYSSGLLYSPLGGLLKEQFGTTTAIFNKLYYNSRGQLAEIRESTSYTGPTDYTYDRGAIINSYSSACSGSCAGTSTPDNNGNLRKQEVLIPGETTRWQSYVYDTVNRLDWVEEGLTGGAALWKQQFTYDRWGNRRFHANTTGAGITKIDFEKEDSTNRLFAPGDLAVLMNARKMQYDAVGNLKNDTHTGAGFRTYDADNRITLALGSGQSQVYGYDSSGRRIKRTVNGVETWQIYGFDGELIAEYAANGSIGTPQKEYGYRDEQLLVTAVPVSGGGGGGSQHNVAWINGVGVSISGNNLTRTAVGDAWNAGAISSQIIASGDGYAEFTATETNKKRAVGLTTSTSVYNFAHISYGIHLGDDGQITIHEGGGVYGVFGTYTTGDVLRVAIESGVVKYRKNGTLLRTSTVAPTYPLYVGAAIYGSAGTVTSAVSTSGLHKVNWTNTVGVSTSGNSLTRTAAGDAWNAGAISTQTLTSGDGYTEVTASETNKRRAVGLTTGTSVYNFAHISYGMHLGDDGQITIHEGGGVYGVFGTYTTGDVLRVAIESGVVKYRKNGTLLRTSTVAPTYPLYAGAALYTNGATVNNVVLNSGGTGGSSTTTKLQWLVSDQLGTPRMIFDQSGDLNKMKRHDYLPFGEELVGGTNASPGPGGRKPSQGYGCEPGDPNCALDGVRQQFTAKERDVETGLDYFGARYFSAVQGRFVSADNIAFSHGTSPQNWNLYAYTSNNPLARVDPDGNDWFQIGNGYGARFVWQKGKVLKDKNGNAVKDAKNVGTHLVVFQFKKDNKGNVVRNKDGAAEGVLTIYKQNKVVAENGAAFTGGRNERTGGQHNEMPPGVYTIRTDIRSAARRGTPLGNAYGLQTLERGMGDTQAWGTKRAALNEWDKNLPVLYRGNFIHGRSNTTTSVTAGCICDRGQTVLDAIFEIDSKTTPRVKAVVTNGTPKSGDKTPGPYVVRPPK